MNGWIKCSEQLPIHELRVLVLYKSEVEEQRIEIAEYIPPRTFLAEHYFNEEAAGCEDYDEINDCYWVAEGWYESSWTADTNWKLGYEPTHWMLLPSVSDQTI